QNGETFTHAYDALSRRTSLTRPNSITTSYSYDDVNRLTRLLHANLQGQSIEDWGYSYGPDGQITSISSLASANLLPQEKTFGPPDAANRIAQIGSSSLGFDAKGQLVSKTESAAATGYQWDARGRLTRVTGGQNIDYGYDGLGRLASRSVGGLTTNFLYSGSEIVLDKASDGSSIDYLAGLGVDEKLRQSGAGDPLYFVQDHLLSVAALTDATGSVVERNQYEPFGNTATSGLTRYGFTGRERDSATGLMYFRARWYDPQQGRFITQDPIGFAGGANLYAYSANDPINLSDPFGLKPCSGSDPLLDFLGGFFNFGSRFNPILAQTDLANERNGFRPHFWSGESPHVISDQFTALTGTVINRNSGAYREGENQAFGVAAGLLTGVAGEALAESLPGLVGELRGAGTAAELEGEGAAFEFESIGREPPPPGGEEPSLVIGKLEDLRKPGAVGPGEYTLEWTNQGSEKLNWKENSSALREAMREGRAIRDVSVDPGTGDYVNDTGFLRAERELLKSKGWNYNPRTTRWYAPR
ncbi:MAG TPA: RHS repeat-associated core domain-containing protein, partial [Blastocatellia bacterium]|nr:RHS repeat-associated core domain-containing protein [Blastocatellia bacterium]